MKPINWDEYNEPPYLPEWMCEDETLELARYDDDLRIKIEAQLRLMSEQYYLENLSGEQLDRIGKLLSEQRNGNSDDYYRIILNLRILLNTNAGSIPDIIKAIKYLYSSEVVHIVPDFPAGLIIEHDGEGTPGLNFNMILAEVIPAGVSFSTKELFLYKEELFLDDKFIIAKITKDLIDSFSSSGIKFNGQIKHDGKHKAGRGIFDKFSILLKPENFVDIFETRIKHSGMIKADGRYKFNKPIGRISDTPVIITGRLKFQDNIIVSDEFKIAVKQQTNVIDYFPTTFRFNGIFKHDGKITASGSRDKLNITVKKSNTTDKHKTRLKHSGTIKANGTHKFNAETGMGDILDVSTSYKYQDNFNTVDGTAINVMLDLHDTAEVQEQDKTKISLAVNDSIEINDEFTIGLKYHHKHDGKYKANGKINFNSGILVPV